METGEQRECGFGLIEGPIWMFEGQKRRGVRWDVFLYPKISIVVFPTFFYFSAILSSLHTFIPKEY